MKLLSVELEVERCAFLRHRHLSIHMTEGVAALCGAVVIIGPRRWFLSRDNIQCNRIVWPQDLSDHFRHSYPLTELSGNCLLILFGSYLNNTKLFRERDKNVFREGAIP